MQTLLDDAIKIQTGAKALRKMFRSIDRGLPAVQEVVQLPYTCVYKDLPWGDSFDDETAEIVDDWRRLMDHHDDFMKNGEHKRYEKIRDRRSVAYNRLYTHEYEKDEEVDRFVERFKSLETRAIQIGLTFFFKPVGPGYVSLYPGLGRKNNENEYDVLLPSVREPITKEIIVGSTISDMAAHISYTCPNEWPHKLTVSHDGPSVTIPGQSNPVESWIELMNETPKGISLAERIHYIYIIQALFHIHTDKDQWLVMFVQVRKQDKLNEPKNSTRFESINKLWDAACNLLYSGYVMRFDYGLMWSKPNTYRWPELSKGDVVYCMSTAHTLGKSHNVPSTHSERHIAAAASAVTVTSTTPPSSTPSDATNRTTKTVTHSSATSFNSLNAPKPITPNKYQTATMKSSPLPSDGASSSTSRIGASGFSTFGATATSLVSSSIEYDTVVFPTTISNIYKIIPNTATEIEKKYINVLIGKFNGEWSYDATERLYEFLQTVIRAGVYAESNPPPFNRLDNGTVIQADIVFAENTGVRMRYAMQYTGVTIENLLPDDTKLAFPVIKSKTGTILVRGIKASSAQQIPSGFGTMAAASSNASHPTFGGLGALTSTFPASGSGAFSASVSSSGRGGANTLFPPTSTVAKIYTSNTYTIVFPPTSPVIEYAYNDKGTTSFNADRKKCVDEWTAFIRDQKWDRNVTYELSQFVKEATTFSTPTTPPKSFQVSTNSTTEQNDAFATNAYQLLRELVKHQCSVITQAFSLGDPFIFPRIDYGYDTIVPGIIAKTEKKYPNSTYTVSLPLDRPVPQYVYNGKKYLPARKISILADWTDFISKQTWDKHIAFTFEKAVRQVIIGETFIPFSVSSKSTDAEDESFAKEATKYIHALKNANFSILFNVSNNIEYMFPQITYDFVDIVVPGIKATIKQRLHETSYEATFPRDNEPVPAYAYNGAGNASAYVISCINEWTDLVRKQTWSKDAASKFGEFCRRVYQEELSADFHIHSTDVGGMNRAFSEKVKTIIGTCRNFRLAFENKSLYRTYAFPAIYTNNNNNSTRTLLVPGIVSSL